jgi:mRNA-degrading endonuclease RelE of RelBE toxin-antitoxin system
MSETSIQVIATPVFVRNLRTLSKKYRNIKNDIQPIIEQLKSGDRLGDQIPNVGYPVFKLRIKNTDVQKGKSGGYRLIYYLKTATNVILLTLYTKSEQADIAADELKYIISAYNRQDIQDSD